MKSVAKQRTRLTCLLLAFVWLVSSFASIQAIDTPSSAVDIRIQDGTARIGNGSLERVFSWNEGKLSTQSIVNNRADITFTPGAGSEDFIISTVMGADAVSPNLELAVTAPTGKLDRAGWSGTVYTEDGQSSASLAKMLNDNTSDYVTLDVPSASYSAIFNLGGSATFRTFSYLKRPGYTDVQWGINGTVEDYEFYVSNDGSAWTKVAQGSFPNAMKKVENLYNVGSEQFVDLGKNHTAHYVKLVATKVMGSPISFSGGSFALYTGAAEPVSLVSQRPLDRTGWTAKGYCESNGVSKSASALLDGNKDSMVEFGFPETVSLPSYFEFDLGETKSFHSFSYLKRPGYTDQAYGINGTISDFNFYVSADGVTWEKVVSGTFPNKMSHVGNLYNVGEHQYINLDKVYSARYVRLEGVSVIGSYTCISGSEFNLYEDTARNPLDKTGWSGTVVPENSLADLSTWLDSNEETFSLFSPVTYPVSVTFSFGRDKTRTFNSFSFTRIRFDYVAPKDYEFYVFENNDWTLAAKGAFADANGAQHVSLDKTYTAAQVKLVVSSVYGDMTDEFGGAEFDLYLDTPAPVYAEETESTSPFIKESFLRLSESNPVIASDIDGGRQLIFTFAPYEKDGALWNIAYHVVMYDGDDFMRSFLEISVPGEDAAKARIDYILTDVFKLDTIDDRDTLWSHPDNVSSPHMSQYYQALGQPVYVNSLYMGSEFPACDTDIVRDADNVETVQIKYFSGKNFTQLEKTADDSFVTWPSVLGAARSNDYLVVQADFFDYIEAISVETSFRIQFNSWYDGVYDISPASLTDSFLNMEKGLTQYGVPPIDSYVADDGWNNYMGSFWALNSKFDNGKLTPVTDLTANLSSSFGLWLGPRGGYNGETGNFGKRMEAAGTGGYNPVSGDICIDHPAYIENVTDLMVDFQHDYNVEYWKLDGFARGACTNEAHGHVVGGYQGMYFMTETWENWVTIFDALRQDRRDAGRDVFINCTSYAMPSPWLLQWVNTMWLQTSSDAGVYGAVGTADDGSRMATSRDSAYYNFYITSMFQFPTGNIYNHDPIYAEGVSMNIGKVPEMTDEQLRRFLYGNAMRGTNFWELYYTYSLFSDEMWRANAEVLDFARTYQDILGKSKMIANSNPTTYNPYAFSAWGDTEGFIMIRNPSPTNTASYTLTLDRLIGVMEGMKDYAVTYVYPSLMAGPQTYSYGDTFSATLNPLDVLIFKFAPKDTTLPALLKTEVTDANTLVLTFDKALNLTPDMLSGIQVGHHTVTDAKLLIDAKALQITVSEPFAHKEAIEATVTVRDLSGNIAADVKAGALYFGGRIVNRFMQASDLSGGASVARDPHLDKEAVSLSNAPAFFSDNASVSQSDKMTLSLFVSTGSVSTTLVAQDSAFSLGLNGEGHAVFTLDDLTVTTHTPVNDGQWHMLTAVKEVNGMIKLYIDGQIDNSCYADGRVRTLSAGAITLGGDGFTGKLSQILLSNDAYAFDDIAQMVEQYPIGGYTIADISAITITGLAPMLPSTVTANYQTGYAVPYGVVWNIDPALYASAGTYAITGVVPDLQNRTVSGTLTVMDDYPGDSFKSGSLDTDLWDIVRPNADKWSLTENGLVITATSGYLDGSVNSNENIFLQTPEMEDYIVTVKMSGRPNAVYCSAGPIIYQDDNNFVKIARKYTSSAIGSRLLSYTIEIGGSTTNIEMADPASGQDIYLALAKQGDLYTAYYSLDGDNWSLVAAPSGTPASQSARFTNARAGVYATTANASVTNYVVTFSDFAFKQYTPTMKIDAATPAVPLTLPVNAQPPAYLWAEALFTDGTKAPVIVIPVLDADKLSEPGSFTATAQVAGESTLIPLHVTVTADNTPVITNVEVTTPTIVETLAANLRINVTGENLDGHTLTAYLSVNGVIDESTATDITSGTALMKIAAAPAADADCQVVVKADGTDAQGARALMLAAYNPEDLWKPILGTDDGFLTVQFAEDIAPGSKGYGAKVGQTAYACEQIGPRLLRINVAADGVAATIMVSGVKYPVLFPSYSFTFTIPNQ